MAAYSNNLRELKILFAGIAIFGIKIDTHKNMGILMLSRFMQRKTMIKMTIQTHQGNNRECFRDVGSFGKGASRSFLPSAPWRCQHHRLEAEKSKYAFCQEGDIFSFLTGH